VGADTRNDGLFNFLTRAPETKIAVICGDEQVTYAALRAAVTPTI
jgi:hypothetical protein